jgi:hypothetical protein
MKVRSSKITGTEEPLATEMSIALSRPEASTTKPTHSFQHYLLETFCINETALKNSKHRTSLHTAIIVKRGKIIAEASNQVGSRSSGAGFSNYTIHAERAVVKKLGDLSKLRGCDLYVFRVGGEENSHASEPCRDCQVFLKKCMREYGLRFVFYSI